MISIVIPTLNEEKYLPRLLESIKRQNFECETIVADAGSTDRTQEIAKSYDCQIIPGGMQARGRNQGAAAARHEFIIFMDADVVLPADFLSGITAEFQSRDLDLATCCALPLSSHPADRLAFFLANLVILGAQWVAPFAHGFFIITRKAFHQKIGGFDETITFGEDSEYVLRGSRAGRFGVLRGNILASTRRFEKEGRTRLIIKYLALNLRRLLRGEIREPIDYPYGRY